MAEISKLRKIRKLLDLTLDEIARDTGLSTGYLNRIERGFVTDIKNLKKRQALENYLDRVVRDASQKEREAIEIMNN